VLALGCFLGVAIPSKVRARLGVDVLRALFDGRQVALIFQQFLVFIAFFRLVFDADIGQVHKD
jgi:hypothetical protein